MKKNRSIRLLPSRNSSSSVLFLMNSGHPGGSELKTIRIANELFRCGVNVTVAHLNKPDPLADAFHNGIKSIYLGRQGKVDFAVAIKVKEYLRKNNCDTLFCVNLYPSLYGFLIKLLLLKYPLKSYSLINVMDLHNSVNRLQMLLYVPVLYSFSGLVFGCQDQKGQWIARYGLPQTRCSYIYNGVDCTSFIPPSSSERFRLREKFGIPPTDTVLVCVAGLRAVKRHMDLIEACHRLHLSGRRVRVILAGDGPERDRLVSATKAAGLTEYVFFFRQMQDVRPVLAVADVFVLCSASETFSNAVLEAMAMGRPVVLSNTGGAPEMIENGSNGYLYEAGNVSDLVGKLTHLVDQPSLRAEMGGRSRVLVEGKFGFQAMIRSYLDLIETGLT